MNYVGIDIAKNFHVVTIIDENETKIFKKAFWNAPKKVDKNLFF
jgi:hypothetical protein